MSQRISRIALAALAVIVLAAPAAAQTGTLKKVKETGTLVIGYRENSKPFSFVGEGGKPAGYSIDLCNRIAAEVKDELKLASSRSGGCPSRSRPG